MDISNNYEVIISDSAKADLEEIYSNISKSLYGNNSVDKLMAKIEQNVLRLEQFPYSCSEITVKPHKEIFRKLVVGDYIALYLIDEEYKQVIIYNVVYCKRDYMF